MLELDSVQIQQLLVNLIRNALEAMCEVPREQRVLTVMTDAVSSGSLEIRVADTGPGLPVDRMEAAFDAFHTTKQEGMGMGLAICRSIAESHSGHLDADNTEQGGAIFTLTLPLSEKDRDSWRIAS